MLLPGAFQQLNDAQASDADKNAMARRNVKRTPHNQQALIQSMQDQASAGVVTGLDQWMAYVSAHSADSPEHAENRQDHMNELREAERHLKGGATKVDLAESEIGGTGKTADLTLQGGAQVEVKTVREPIRTASDLTSQLAAGLAKFASAPSGHYEVSIYGSIDESLFGAGKSKAGKRPSTTVADPGALTITTNQKHPETDNVIHSKVLNLVDELVRYLGRNPAGASRVSKVNIIMENAGSYFAEKLPTGWRGGRL